MRSLRSLYPLLFVAFPVLGIAARNPGSYALGDLLSVLLVLLAAFGLLLGIATLVFRRLGPDVPPLLTFVAALVFFFYLPAREWLDTSIDGTVLDQARIVPITLGTALLALVGWLSVRRDRIAGARVGLSAMGVLLVVWTGGQVALHHLRGGPARNSAVARELAKPVPRRAGAIPGPRRDIYLIILDAYANAGVLREFYDFDNRPFEDSLRALGFTIPATRSNYDFTEVAIPSLLNFSQLTDLEKELGASTDRTLPRYLIQHNRLERFLRSQGYAYVVVPAGWDPTEYSADADRIMRQSTSLDLAYELDRTELRQVVRATTLLDRFLPPPRWSASLLLNAFDSLQALPSDPRPTFALAHFMLPHRPYRYQADCRPAPRSEWEVPTFSPAAKAGYLGQVQCANRRVLETVTALLTRSTPAPIIVIQADHGSRSTPDSARTTADGFRRFARERLGAFGAYYLPDGGSARLTGTVTPVNVFRHVLSYYFGAELSPDPDHSYLLAPDASYRFTRADTALAGMLGSTH